MEGVIVVLLVVTEGGIGGVWTFVVWGVVGCGRVGTLYGRVGVVGAVVVVNSAW